MTFQRFLRRTKIALRLAFPTRWELSYIRQAKRSGLFDRQFYLGTNPSLHWLHRAFPERHFVQLGEGLGLCPNPDFSPAAYLRHNPDLAALQCPPFLHFLRFGRHELRLTKDLPQDAGDMPICTPRLGPQWPRGAPQAIVIHIYYHDLWDEFAQLLRAVEFDFDLFITLSYRGEESAALADRIAEEFPQARVVPVRNHGRDIFPFLLLVNAGWLDGYEAVCKLHSKKSPHRMDGAAWRRHLVGGILGEPATAKRLERFKSDPEAAFWVADGQHFTGTEWWGSNASGVADILRRVEIGADPERLSFPAGSIYWLKPLMIDMIRGLELCEADFEQEAGQTDGTLAHAVERALGGLAEAAGQKIRQTSELDTLRLPAQHAAPRYVSAFYLPQFHPIAENDAWWGKGFTEWTGVTRAVSQFAGHKQPCYPADLGFYDLRHTETMGAQAALARAAGIDAFCVYHYWFDGRRVLEAPLDRLLQRPDVDFPFYLCWANESWRRNWDGLSGEVLLHQSYAEGFEAALAQSLAPYFADPRYQRPDGTRPRLVIYRPDDMPAPEANVARLRRAFGKLGVGEVELGAVRFHLPGEHPVAEALFDFWIEMPPHGLVGEEEYLFGGPQGDLLPAEVSPGFSGLIYDYRRLAARSTARGYLKLLPENTIAGIMPSWDNTARRGARAHIAWGANPASFERWLRHLCAHRLKDSYRGELFVNAWNEWAEKAVLEPGAQYGQAWLRALARHSGAQPDARAQAPAAEQRRSSAAS